MSSSVICIAMWSQSRSKQTRKPSKSLDKLVRPFLRSSVSFCSLQRAKTARQTWIPPNTGMVRIPGEPPPISRPVREGRIGRFSPPFWVGETVAEGVDPFVVVVGSVRPVRRLLWPGPSLGGPCCGKELQPSKAPSSMCVSELRMVKLANELQPKKAPSPMWVTEFGMVKFAKELHS